MRLTTVSRPLQIFRRAHLRFSSTSSIIRLPPQSAPRTAPTPLVFISANEWDDCSSKGMTNLSSMLAEKGFTCIQADLGVGKDSFTDATNLMKAYESEMRSAIRLSTIPFPSVIVARSSACLIAQTYISSHPAAGLVLISPPASNDELLGSKLSTRLKEFDFEPTFPIAIMGTQDEIRHLTQANRLCQKEYATVDVLQLSDLDGQEAFVKLDSWLDELGI